jgi:hypothetical protein
MDFSLPVAAHPSRSLMLQAFTGVSKVEKAQKNRCQTSPSKFGQQSQQNKSPTKNEKMKKVIDKETKLVYESAS